MERLTQAKHARRTNCICLRLWPSSARMHRVGCATHAETLPQPVRDAITAKLRDFLDRNLEDA